MSTFQCDSPALNRLFLELTLPINVDAGVDKAKITILHMPVEPSNTFNNVNSRHAVKLLQNGHLQSRSVS